MTVKCTAGSQRLAYALQYAFTVRSPSERVLFRRDGEIEIEIERSESREVEIERSRTFRDWSRSRGRDREVEIEIVEIEKVEHPDVWSRSSRSSIERSKGSRGRSLPARSRFVFVLPLLLRSTDTTTGRDLLIGFLLKSRGSRSRGSRSEGVVDRGFTRSEGVR